MNKKPVTVGTKEALGFGVIGLGLITVFLPLMVQRIDDLEFIQSDGFSMLAGSTMVFAILFIIAGAVIAFSKFDDHEE